MTGGVDSTVTGALRTMWTQVKIMERAMVEDVDSKTELADKTAVSHEYNNMTSSLKVALLAAERWVERRDDRRDTP